MRSLYRRVIAGLILITLVVAARPMAALGQDLEYVSSTLFGGSYPGRMEIDGYLLTMWWEGAFQVFSVDDSLSPQQVGGNAFIRRAIGIGRAGDHVYITDWIGRSKLKILDISDVSRTTLIAELDFGHGLGFLAVSGDYVYACGDELYIFDVSDAHNPYLAGRYDTPGDPFDIVIADTLAYLTIDGLGMTILDISDPVSPEQIGIYAGDFWNPPRLFVQGSYAVLILDQQLLVVDVSVPTDPVIAGQCYLALDFTIECCVSGDYAYVTSVDGFSEEAGVAIVDISNPSDPAVVGFIDESQQGCIGIAVAGSYAYIGVGGPLDMETWDISDPTNPTPVGGYQGRGFIPDVVMIEGIAYAPDYVNGLNILDMSVPERPEVVSQYDSPWHMQDLSLDSTLAYLAGTNLGLEIVDIADSYDPEYVGSYALERGTGIFVSGDYAYVTEAWEGLFIFDISDPTIPSLVGTTAVADWPQGVYVQGNYAYVACFNWGGFQVVDVSDPTNPFVAGWYDTPGHAVKVDISGDYAYVADGESGVQIFDITDPTEPVLAGNFDPRPYYQNYVNDIEIFDNYLAVAEESLGVYVLDISDPTNPAEVAFFDTPGGPEGLSVFDDYILVADQTSLMLLRFTRTDVEEDGSILPNQIALLQNYPNPFNASTLIEFGIAEEGRVMLAVYDLLGRKVIELLNADMAIGQHSVLWDGKDQAGNQVRSGIYFYTLREAQRTITKKMVLLK